MANSDDARPYPFADKGNAKNGKGEASGNGGTRFQNGLFTSMVAVARRGSS